MHRNFLAGESGGSGKDPSSTQPPHSGRRVRVLPAGCLAAALGLTAQLSCATTLPTDRLAGMSFDELASIQVTSVSKKAERLADAAASVFVITGEDIRRSGATNLPEALRLAPNLQVAKVSAQSYAISARGFNSTTANKLLVLIDGRTVYTPLYSGVFWDAQDVMLEDVERIEVISGPGGTLWGTNAVNGVVNVITRSANDTQGGLLTAGAGNRENDAGFRYGAELGKSGHYRIYGQYSDRDHTSTASGSTVPDGWNMARAGFRADWGDAQEQLTMQGDINRADLEQRLASGKTSGLNVMTRWNRKLADESSINLAAYYDRTERDFPGTYHETLDIVDIQFQHTLQPIASHAIVWGASYRHGADREDNGNVLAFLPARLGQKWVSLFAQDDVELRSDLRLILGARLEHNDYTGREVLPNARLAWKLSDDSLLWTSISRTVRAPSRIDRDFYAPPQPPYLLTGNTSFRSEIAKVAEVGYRAQATKTVSWSITGFHARYDHLRSIERLPSGAYVIGNQMEGSTSGIEAWGTYQAMPDWRLSAGFSALRERLRLLPGSTDPMGPSGAGNDPAHSWQLRSTWDIAAGRELDLMVRRVGALPKPAVPAYTAVDLRFGWKLRPDLDLSLIGQNLCSGKHAEFGSLPGRSEIASGVFARLQWHV